MKFSHELSTAIRAAKAAGAIQLRHFGRPLKKTMKIGVDFATQVDFACEKAVLGILQKDFPEYGVLSEEIGEIPSDSDYRWIVDPLDGTLPYARGLDSFGALVSLQKKDTIELGVIFRPQQKELLFAQSGRGAFLNGGRLKVSRVNRLSEASVSYQDIRFANRVCPEGFNELLSQAGLVLGMPWLDSINALGRGQMDIQVGYAAHLWDFAPAQIIAKEAGGIFSDYNNNCSLSKGPGCLTTNGRLHKKVLKFLHEPKEADA